jgi:hypothetical protein
MMNNLKAATLAWISAHQAGIWPLLSSLPVDGVLAEERIA